MQRPDLKRARAVLVAASAVVLGLGAPRALASPPQQGPTPTRVCYTWEQQACIEQCRARYGPYAFAQCSAVGDAISCRCFAP
ncbi:MAG TPA: hypothetical protein VF263_23760 [Longimicrobiaceae bacterium]